MALTKLSTDVIDLSNNTEALTIPSGTTASPVDVEYLVVAGGGGGGYAYAGGGGAGGYLTNFGATKISLTIAAAYTITVGDGGAGGIQSSSTLPINGGNSVFSGGSGFTASGGGTGGNDGNDNATLGGSGGGASRNNPNSGVGPSPYVQAGGVNGTPSSQGNIGGEAYYPTPNSYGWFSGGGGGAGGAGENGKDTSYANGGAGGIGLQNNIDGNNYFYAGGGGGDGTRISSGAIAGGVGGSSIGGTGGHYSTSTESPPTDASPANRGSGGGGGANYDDTPVNANGGAGSSGVVILRYPTANPITIGASLTHSSITIDSDTITTFTAGSDTISFGGVGAGRPSSPTEGLLRDNTTTGALEFYDGSLWQQISGTLVSDNPPSDNFNTVIWTSTGGNTDISITGVGFKPDFVWAKSRTDAYNHTLYDSARGAGTNHWLASDLSNSESSLAASAALYGYLGSFDNDGFTGKAGTSDNSYFNYNTNKNYVGWNWKAGGAATTIASGTNGSTVASDVSANQAAGFSIVKYTTAGVQTISHGLSKAPEIIINKISNASVNWNVYTQTTGTGHLLKLNLGDATAADSVFMTAVGADTFSTKWSDGSYNYINYCWHSVPGYSKIGFYVGNLNSTGPIVYTGFKPAWLMIKSTGADNWIMLDNKRSTSNPRQAALFANLSDAEYPTYGANVNFLDTGFQIVNTDGVTNALGVTYIYMTFSE